MQFFWILFLVVVFVVSFISIVSVVSVISIVSVVFIIFIIFIFVMVGATVVLKKLMEIFEVHSRNRVDVVFFVVVGVVLTTWHEDMTVALNVTTENF